MKQHHHHLQHHHQHQQQEQQERHCRLSHYQCGGPAWEQAMDMAVRIFRCLWLLSLCLSLSLPGVQCQQSFRPAGVYTSGTSSGSGSGHGSRNGGTSAYGAVNSGPGPRYRMTGPSVSSSRAQVSSCSLTSAFIVWDKLIAAVVVVVVSV